MRTNGAENSSRRHFGGYVHEAIEPCGGRRMRVRQNRVVLAVVATVKLSRRCLRAQPGGQHRQFAKRGRPEGTRLPGEHGISRPTTAQGRPSDWHHLYAAVRFFLRVLFAQRTAGARSAPGLPCALLLKRVERQSKARAKRAAGTTMRVCSHTLAVIAQMPIQRCPGEGQDPYREVHRGVAVSVPLNESSRNAFLG